MCHIKKRINRKNINVVIFKQIKSWLEIELEIVDLKIKDL